MEVVGTDRQKAEVLAALQRVLDAWTEEHRDASGVVQPGLLGTAVAVVRRLGVVFPLTESNVATHSQIKGQGGPAIRRVLTDFGETRRFLAEGGRTSRGNRAAGIALALRLTEAGETAGLLSLGDSERTAVVDDLKRHLVKVIGAEYFDRQRITIDYVNPNAPVSEVIQRLLSSASERSGTVGGAVAQHLVGATLELMYPEAPIGREGYTTGDAQTGRAGDFAVKDAVFHVTLRPTDALFSSRCTHNLQNGYLPRVLVPRNRAQAAEQLAEIAGIAGDIEVVAIETWVGQSLEGRAAYGRDQIRAGLKALLETYNERVRHAEADQSLQVELPSNL